MIETYLNPDAVIGHSIIKDKVDTRIIGAQTTTSLTNIPVECREVHAIIENSAVLSFASQPEEGCPIEIYIDHQITGEVFDELDSIIVTLPNSGVYACACPDTITILEGEYARVTARTFNGKTYIDAQVFYYIETKPIASISQGETLEKVLLMYGNKCVGMNSSRSTIVTTEIGEAIIDDRYKFNIIYKEEGRVAIQSVYNTSYYLGSSASWSTTSYSWYWDGTHFANSNKTDGSGRLYLNGTTLTVGKTNGGVWTVSQPQKAAK